APFDEREMRGPVTGASHRRLLVLLLVLPDLAGAVAVAVLQVLLVPLEAADVHRAVLAALRLVAGGEDRARAGAYAVPVPQMRLHGTLRDADRVVTALPLRARAGADPHLLAVLRGHRLARGRPPH